MFAEIFVSLINCVTPCTNNELN